MKSPAVRFVERCGGQTLGELLGSSNPWARDFRCGREGCIPCQGRDLLAEEDSLKLIPAPGQPVPPKPGKDETRSLPKCTVEGIGYVLECWTCRLTGSTFKYIGESSRSAYQRGKEHIKEIIGGKKTHPMVEHFGDCHQGQTQEVLFRTFSNFQTALARQVWESIEIDQTTLKLGKTKCLNNKTEWGLSKDPALVPRKSPLTNRSSKAKPADQPPNPGKRTNQTKG